MKGRRKDISPPWEEMSSAEGTKERMARLTCSVEVEERALIIVRV